MNLNQKYSFDDIFIEFGVRRLKYLQNWREIVKRIRNVVQNVLKDVQVYVFGSVVEGRYTVLSDIDVAIVMNNVPEKASERIKIIDLIFREIEDICPWIECPVEIHLLTPIEKEILEKGGAKFVRIE